MATTNFITSLGAADIDTKELTDNLVAATKEPRQKIIDAERQKAQVAISSAALLKNGLAALQAAATEIGSSTKLNKVQISVSNPSVLQASPVNTATARAGNYSVTVEQLAKPQRMTASFAKGFSTTEAITLTLSVPGASADAEPLELAAGRTPAQIVSSINSWIGANAPSSGFSATLIDTDKGATPLRIVLQGDTGEANAFSVATAITDADPAVASADLVFSMQDTATNARFTVNGIEVERPSNKATDVISGLSLEFGAASATPVVISARPDPAAIVEKIQAFIETYNTVSDFIKSATGPKVAGDDVAGSLQNDATARSILSKLRTAMTSQFSELATKPTSITHWSSMGVAFDKTGKLQFENEARFRSAYESSPQDVVTALSNNAPSPYVASKQKSGLAGDIAVISYQMINTPSSTVPALSKSYEGRLSRLDKQQIALDSYIDRIRANYDKQFTALNSALAAFKNTSSQLEKSLNLNNKN